jgi:hypothetical protein
VGEAVSDPTRVPDLLLERYRLGEMSDGERRLLEQRLAESPESRERLTRLEGSELEIRRRHPPEWLARQVRARLRTRVAMRRRSRWARRWSWAAALASAAAAVAVVAHRSGPLPAPSVAGGADHATTREADRIKGFRPSITVYRKTSRGSELLDDGARARAGDVVRLGYRAAGPRYGALFSIDGRGVLTRHLPKAGNLAVPLRAGETVLLDQAYELDDAPRFERFYLVASGAPFELEAVLGAARRAAASHGRTSSALALPDGFEQSTLLLDKEGRE